METRTKEFDTGHPARWNGYTTVNRAERKRKQAQRIASGLLFRLGRRHLTLGYTVPEFQWMTKPAPAKTGSAEDVECPSLPTRIFALHAGNPLSRWLRRPFPQRQCRLRIYPLNPPMRLESVNKR
jgi:hypothetical protein